jgi:hypothetical protein
LVILKNKSNKNRRSFLRWLGKGSLFLPSASTIVWQSSRNVSYAQPTPENKFVQIFLSGGWDSGLATDPIIGSKASSSGYESVYKSLQSKTVPGKSRLIVGEGLMPATNAFANMPTSFVNGLFVEVTAHDLATKYLLTGKMTLSRSSNQPAFIATLAQRGGHFPAHVVFGDRMPLGDTGADFPPIEAYNVEGINEMLKPPLSNLPGSVREDIYALTDNLNSLRFGSTNQDGLVTTWNAADRPLPALYDQGFTQRMEVSESLRDRYAFDSSEAGGRLASVYQVLKTGLTPYVTAFCNDYDTHSNHLGPHRQTMQEFATALSTFVTDLRATPDPHNNSLTLAETTTILIHSEFVRTPKFNLNAGTDHWQSASAIVMGRGVRDNQKIGRTDDQAEATGWSNGKSVPRTASTAIKPEHLASAILRHMEVDDEAEKLGSPLNGLFE